MRQGTIHLPVGKGRPKLPSNVKLNDNIVVSFWMWGQLCRTEFDDTSELMPIAWLQRLYDKGWLIPYELVLADGSLVMDEKELLFHVDPELYDTRYADEEGEEV